jgi:hypothetical protein
VEALGERKVSVKESSCTVMLRVCVVVMQPFSSPRSKGWKGVEGW